MPRYSDRDYALVGAEEATPGVAVVLNPALHAIRLMSKPAFNPEYLEREDKSIAQAYGDGISSVIGKTMSLEVSFYLRSGGGLGIIPDFAPLIACADHNLVSTLNTSVLISPTSARGSARKTATFDWYDNGLVYHFVGAKASAFTFEQNMDGSVTAKVTILAAYADPQPAAVLPATLAYQQSDKIDVMASDVVTEAGISIAVGSFSFDSSLAASQARYIGQTEVHTDDRPKPTITFSKASLTFAADHGKLLASTLAIFTSKSGAAGNRITFSAPQGQYTSLKSKANNSLVDDECVIALRGRDSAYQILID